MQSRITKQGLNMQHIKEWSKTFGMLLLLGALLLMGSSATSNALLPAKGKPIVYIKTSQGVFSCQAGSVGIQVRGFGCVKVLR